MADITDYASESEEMMREIAIAQARQFKMLPTKGACYNCDETIHTGLFCSTECREDYELRNRRGVR